MNTIALFGGGGVGDRLSREGESRVLRRRAQAIDRARDVIFKPSPP